MATWNLEVSSPLGKIVLSLDDLRALGEETVTFDFHCVTTWSALSLNWTGVAFSKIIERCRDILPDNWEFLLQTAACGYTTNVPRRDVERSDIYLVYKLGDEFPIPIEHGTVRILFPHL